MTTITVYDPAMCCSTGICGTDVDQRLVDLSANLDWLKAQGVSVQRFGLSREPAEFAANDTIRQIMLESEGDDLPAFIVDGALKAKARYPSRDELAEWAGLAAPKVEITAALASKATGSAEKLPPEATTASECSDTSQEKKVEANSCCGGAQSAPANEKAGSCC